MDPKLMTRYGLECELAEQRKTARDCLERWRQGQLRLASAEGEAAHLRRLLHRAIDCADQMALGWERHLRIILKDAPPETKADNASDKPSQPSA